MVCWCELDDCSLNKAISDFLLIAAFTTAVFMAFDVARYSYALFALGAEDLQNRVIVASNLVSATLALIVPGALLGASIKLMLDCRIAQTREECRSKCWGLFYLLLIPFAPVIAVLTVVGVIVAVTLPPFAELDAKVVYEGFVTRVVASWCAMMFIGVPTYALIPALTALAEALRSRLEALVHGKQNQSAEQDERALN